MACNLYDNAVKASVGGDKELHDSDAPDSNDDREAVFIESVQDSSKR